MTILYPPLEEHEKDGIVVEVRSQDGVLRGRLLVEASLSSGRRAEVLAQLETFADALGEVIVLGSEVQTYAAIARGIPGGAVLLFDEHLRIFAAEGEELLRALDLPLRSLIGSVLSAVATHANVSALRALVEDALAGRRSEIELVRNGRVCLLRGAPVTEGLDGTRRAAAIVVVDVTARANAERRMELLHDIALVTTEERDARGIARRAMRLATAGLGLARAEVAWMDPAGGGRLQVAYAVEDAPSGAPTVSWTLDRGAPPRVEVVPRGAVAEETLVRIGELLGRVEERQHLQHELRRTAAEGQAASHRDDLTGLANRRGFQSAAEAHDARARRERTPYLVVFADLDGLKAINDRHGHAAGDRAIRAAAVALRGALRGDDVVARLAGDEFVVLVPGVGRSGAAILRARILDAMAQANGEWPHAEQPLRASTGLAAFDPAGDEPLESLLRRADDAMYEEKRKRRLDVARVRGHGRHVIAAE